MILTFLHYYGVPVHRVHLLYTTKKNTELLKATRAT